MCCPRRCADWRRLYDSAALKHSGIESLASVPDLARHPDQIIGKRLVSELNWIGPQIRSVIKSSGWIPPDIHRGVRRPAFCGLWYPTGPRNSQNGCALCRDLGCSHRWCGPDARIYCCRWNVWRNYDLIVLITAVGLAHAEEQIIPCFSRYG